MHYNQNPRQLAGILILLFCHDASSRSFKEVDDIPNLGTIGHLIPDLINHIKHTGLSVEEQSIGIGDVLLHLLVDTGLIHHRGVRTAIHQRFSTCNDKWRHILREGTTRLNESQTAHTGVGILNGTAGEDGAIANLTVAGNLHTVAEHAVVAHHGVVADVSTLKQEVVVADNGGAISLRTTVDDDILADDIVVTNPDIRLSTSEVKVLR